MATNYLSQMKKQLYLKAKNITETSPDVSLTPEVWISPSREGELSVPEHILIAIHRPSLK